MRLNRLLRISPVAGILVRPVSPKQQSLLILLQLSFLTDASQEKIQTPDDLHTAWETIVVRHCGLLPYCRTSARYFSSLLRRMYAISGPGVRVLSEPANQV